MLLAQAGPLVLPGAAAQPAISSDGAPQVRRSKPKQTPKSAAGAPPPGETNASTPSAPAAPEAAAEPGNGAAPPAPRAKPAARKPVAQPPAAPPEPVPEALPGFEHMPPPPPKPPEPPASAKPKAGSRTRPPAPDPAGPGAAPEPGSVDLGYGGALPRPVVLPSLTTGSVAFGIGLNRLQPLVLADPGLLSRRQLMLSEPVLTNPDQWEDPEGRSRSVRTASTPTVRPLHPMLAFVPGQEPLYELKLASSDSIDTAPLALNSIEALRQGVPVGPFRAGLIEENGNGAPRIETGTVIWQLEGADAHAAENGAHGIRAVASLGRGPVRAVLTLRNEPGEEGAGPLTMDLELVIANDGVAQGGIPELRNAGIDRGVALFARASMAGDTVRYVFPADQADGDQNVRLLTSRSWIDIPVRLKSGRRIVIALEKGSAVRDMMRETFRLWRLPWLP